jgi:phenylpropionate dioxygenase-like ring-hydroxylating dioxygenase large terminal subunit
VLASNSQVESPSIDQRLAAVERQVKAGALPLWVFHDQQLYGLELERIFGRSWVFLAHETEIPNPGDYVARSIGNDPFIVVRGHDNIVRVLFDSCRHRGARLCLADKGNTKSFFCPYHGWTYRNTGDLTGVPNIHTAYKALDLKQWGLLPAPRAETYRGLIFASLDPNICPLLDYLGDYRWYLDLHLALSPNGMEVLGEPHRWHIEADWKSGSDNFAGDSYHTQTLHQSIVRLGLSNAAGASGGKNDIHVTECSGHSTSIRRRDPGETYFWGYPEEVYQEFFNGSELSPEQFEVAKRSVVYTGTIFPNLSMIHIFAKDAPDNEGAAFFSLRQWKPRGPGKMEAWSWVLVPKSAPAKYKELAYRAAVASFSPSGNFEQDDSIAWGGVSRAARGQFAKQQNITLNYQMGLEGMSDAKVMTDWPGPGIAYDSNLEEGVQRTFWRHWSRAMSDGTKMEQASDERR